MWLVTSSTAGRPHIVPMWFLWDSRTISLFSLPAAAATQETREEGHLRRIVIIGRPGSGKSP
ncbi:MAG: hypothetical protein JO081_15015 [Alphaproteobacteria bacterium]|nr:hypothetical protein [Alphaproteobacteria bacterium]